MDNHIETQTATHNHDVDTDGYNTLAVQNEKIGARTTVGTVVGKQHQQTTNTHTVDAGNEKHRVSLLVIHIILRTLMLTPKALRLRTIIRSLATLIPVNLSITFAVVRRTQPKHTIFTIIMIITVIIIIAGD